MEPVQPAEFEELIRELRKQSVLDWSEKRAQIASVVPTLIMLGWHPAMMGIEVNIGNRRNRGVVDIKLNAGKHSVLVECKKPRIDLDHAVDQLFEYAFYEGSHLAVLTNGVRWDLYLAYGAEVPTRERRFASIDLQSRKSPAELFAELSRFLEHGTVKSGKAKRNAKDRLKAKQHGNKVKDAMPVVWKELLDNPPDGLIDLIEKGVQRHIGHSPTTHQVREFLSKRGEIIPPMPSELATQYRRRSSAKRQTKPTGRKSPRKISAFSLWGQRAEVTTWISLFFEVSVMVYRRHGSDFARLINEVTWAARSNSGMIKSRRIPKSPYYINTHGGAPDLEDRARKLLVIFGHSQSDLIIESSDSSIRRKPRTRRSSSDGRRAKTFISAFSLWGQRTAVTSWGELLIGVTATMYKRHRNDFDHMTKQVSWLSRKSTFLKKPNAVPGSPYYVNSYAAGAKALKARCRRLLKIFGYSPDDLKIIE